MTRLLTTVSAILLLLCLASCQTAPILVRESPNPALEDNWNKRSALVVLAVDFREKTMLRDNVTHFGSIYFRRIDDSYAKRQRGDYDFGIQYSVAADWKAVAGQLDENRTPRLFKIEPGEYVVERIDIGSRPTTPLPGFDPKLGTASMGRFSVHAGDVLNLGKIVLHMHFHEGRFSTVVQDNTDEAIQFLLSKYPTARPLLRTNLLKLDPYISLVM